MKFNIADVVRFKDNRENPGLYEVAGYNESEVVLTGDECLTEFGGDEEDLILICRFENRKDIQK